MRPSQRATQSARHVGSPSLLTLGLKPTRLCIASSVIRPSGYWYGFRLSMASPANIRSSRITCVSVRSGPGRCSLLWPTLRTILPGVSVIQRLCADALVASECRIDSAVVARLNEPMKARLDGLLTEMVDGKVSRAELSGPIYSVLFFAPRRNSTPSLPFGNLMTGNPPCCI